MTCSPDRRQQLLNNFRSAVMSAARERGHDCRDFGEALLALPREEADSIREAYKKQVEVLDEQAAD